jgi:fumarate reductase subunit D
MESKITRPSGMTLFRVGGIAALTIVLLIPIQIVIFVVWPPPNTVIGWFTLFQDSPVVGLIDMDLLLIVDSVLVVMVFLALWAALRRINESLMIIALPSDDKRSNLLCIDCGI